MWRFVPLAIFLAYRSAVSWRASVQRERFGTHGAPRSPERDTRERLGIACWLVFMLLLLCGSILAACGTLELAASTAQRVLGAVLGFGGVLGMLSAQLQMGASWRTGIDAEIRPGLVTAGWFRYCRNPVWVFLFLVSVGEALLLPSAWTLAALASLAVGIRLRVAAEEDWLLRTYGEEYRRYAGATGRFLPWLGRMR